MKSRTSFVILLNIISEIIHDLAMLAVYMALLVPCFNQFRLFSLKTHEKKISNQTRFDRLKNRENLEFVLHENMW
jgi:hypothetical protein